MTHPAAELLRAIADGKQIERIDATGSWYKCTTEAALYALAMNEHKIVRIARPMVTREVSYPEPLRVKPVQGFRYWYTTATHRMPTNMMWYGNDTDNHIFNAGMAFATEADAAEAHKALFGGGV